MNGSGLISYQEPKEVLKDGARPLLLLELGKPKKNGEQYDFFLAFSWKNGSLP